MIGELLTISQQRSDLMRANVSQARGVIILRGKVHTKRNLSDDNLNEITGILFH